MALPRMVNDKKLRNSQWHLQEQKQILHEHVLLLKAMLEKNYARQIQNENDSIRSNIARMQPGVQKSFLKFRLDKLKGV